MTPELVYTSAPGRRTRGLRLEELARAMGAAQVLRSRNVEVRGLAADSREVASGFLFFAVPGTVQDGAAFATRAVGKGAVAVVATRPLPVPVPVVLVEDVRAACALAARRFHGHPSSRMRVLGVTGTNGKTTVAWLVRQILAADGVEAGCLATTGWCIGERTIPAPQTTPDPIRLHQFLRDMLDLGLRAAVVETSSHALHQKRVLGVRFAAAAITNLSHDHLDYHGSMDAYREAKLRLFRSLEPGAAAVVPADDPVGVAALEACPPGVRTFTFGLRRRADFHARVRKASFEGLDLDVETPEGSVRFVLPLPGAHNAENALAAMALACSQGVGTLAAVGALERCRPPRGRLDPVGKDTPFRVLVDYAHTPEALRCVLEALRPDTPGRLLVLFGCGGDRDRAKRAPMGAAVAQAADVAVLTSDNPRGEDPLAIMEEVERGFAAAAGRCLLVREPDRRAAIGKVLSLAAAGDTVLLAGKGHETYQEANGTVVPFDDRAVAEEWL